MSTDDLTPSDRAAADAVAPDDLNAEDTPLEERDPDFRALPEPEDFPRVAEGFASESIDDMEGDVPAAVSDDMTLLDDADPLNVASEVTAEDMGSDELLDNGLMPEDIELDQVGIREFDADLADPRRHDTIEDRIRQEEPDPSSDIVPKD